MLSISINMGVIYPGFTRYQINTKIRNIRHLWFRQARIFYAHQSEQVFRGDGASNSPQAWRMVHVYTHSQPRGISRNTRREANNETWASSAFTKLVRSQRIKQRCINGWIISAVRIVLVVRMQEEEAGCLQYIGH